MFQRAIRTREIGIEMESAEIAITNALPIRADLLHFLALILIEHERTDRGDKRDRTVHHLGERGEGDSIFTNIREDREGGGGGRLRVWGTFDTREGNDPISSLANMKNVCL